jgi:hypothetical protein
VPQNYFSLGPCTTQLIFLFSLSKTTMCLAQHISSSLDPSFFHFYFIFIISSALDP